MFLSKTTILKQKSCDHDYHVKYAQGTNKSFRLCLKCHDQQSTLTIDVEETS